MTAVKFLACSICSVALVSCADKPDRYETANPYGAANPGAAAPSMSEPVNPIYDTPAAYEESGAVSSVPPTTVPPVTAAGSYIPQPTAPASPSNGAAIIHTVVAGDTLSGISAKYKVPSAVIKQANGMTKDTVVLGKKMVIPPM